MLWLLFPCFMFAPTFTSGPPVLAKEATPKLISQRRIEPALPPGVERDPDVSQGGSRPVGQEVKVV